MAQTQVLIERAADEATSAGMFIDLVCRDGRVDPDEVAGLRATGRALLALARLLERIALGARVIEQIWRLGLEHAPNERLLRHLRHAQATPRHCPPEGC